MAPNRVPVTVKFSKPGVQPPVYLAGSFSDPAWQPQEMQHTTESAEYMYKKEVEVEEGKEYQYKFRIGEGDWWVVDDNSQIATDDIGNQNNLLTVPIHEELEEPQEPPESPKMSSEQDVIVEPITVDKEDDEVDHKNEAEVETQEPSASVDGAEEKSDPLKLLSLEHTADKKGEKVSFTSAAEIDDFVSRLSATYPPPILDGIGESQGIETTRKEHVSDENVAPTLIVEKTDSTPSFGDDFGSKAKVAEKDAHLLRAKDAEPDYVVVRSETRTPDHANVASEVADSAATLDRDRDPPTPPISDEEAGGIGYRRMSSTPIPEVAKTAAEVADSAAIIDKEAFVLKIEVPPPLEEPELDSGATTPWDERAPRFAHECPEPPTGALLPAVHEESPVYEGRGPRDPYENAIYDPNDPSIEEFPRDRKAILEQVRSCQRRLSEDETSIEGIPPSPVVGANYHPERLDLPSPSPNILARHEDRSPSLGSIPEEGGHRELLSELPKALITPKSVPDFEGVGSSLIVNGTDGRETSVEVEEVGAESPPPGPVEPIDSKAEEHTDEQGVTQMPAIPLPIEEPAPFVEENSVKIDDESTREIVTPVEGPNITIQPATPGSSLNSKRADPFIKSIAVDTAKATAIEEENGRTTLKSRKAPSPTTDRPRTPNSMRSEPNSKNFLKVFLNLVFVEWIGGLIMRLCGGGRTTLIAITVLVLIAVAPALYFSA